MRPLPYRAATTQAQRLGSYRTMGESSGGQITKNIYKLVSHLYCGDIVSAAIDKITCVVSLRKSTFFGSSAELDMRHSISLTALRLYMPGCVVKRAILISSGNSNPATLATPVMQTRRFDSLESTLNPRYRRIDTRICLGRSQEFHSKPT